ncbi:MAG: hypothetical protein JNK74_14425 [Candidatus Hydrogenedentes bacterium]|nr:hypothetical protein [Candidatus Hydrogenedentota bacterium]
MLLLGLIPPLTHFWIGYFPPEGAVPTGLYTGDSGHHLLAMASFANGFHSPFATCLAQNTNDAAYFSVPIFLLYGVVGEIGRMTALTPFLFLGIANGVGGALLLWNVYRFLRRIAPKDAALAFYLYALGGGLAGMVFLAAWLTGGVGAPGFEAWFTRFAQYELIEGQYLSPILLMPRLYYTLPMALGFAALTALVETDRCRCPGHLFFTCFLLLVTASINVRVAPLFWGAGAAYLLLGSGNDGRYRAWLAGCTFGVTTLGGAIAIGVMGQHPSYTANVSSVARECALLLPLLYATMFFWPSLALGLRNGVSAQSRALRSVSLALLGYLAAYALVYLAHQIWFGNWWRGGDMGAAVLASDWALSALLPGALLGWRWRAGETTQGAIHLRWVAAWFLVLLAVSVSTTGQGWLLQFAPQRCLVLLGVPMALLAAAGLRTLPKMAARVCVVLVIGGGVLSQAVAALYFQGPLGRTPGEGPFAYLHYEYMTEADARLLAQLPSGTVAVPPWSPIAFGEIVAHHGDYQVIGGPGAMNLGDQPFGPLQESVNRFFSPEASEAERRDYVAKWCVDFVFCPDTCPVDPAVLEGLRRLPWLAVVAEEGRGVVFRVEDEG